MSEDFKTTIYQRDLIKKGEIFKNGQWVAKIVLPPDPLTGKARSPKTFTSVLPGIKGKQDVTRRMNEVLEQLKNGNISSLSTLTLGGWLDQYFDLYTKKLQETTKEGYTMYIETHIKPNIGDIKLGDLKPMHIDNFYNHERTVQRKDGKIGYSEKTLLQIHRILHRALKKAAANNLIRINPLDGVDTPSPEDYEPVVYNEEQFNLLMEKLEGHPMEAFILIAGFCGLRKGELLGLTWEDIDFEKETINVHNNRVAIRKKEDSEVTSIEKTPKTKKSARSFGIPSGIMPRLKELRGIGKIFTKLDGTEYHPGSVSWAFSEFLKTNNLPHCRLHDLRHFNITMMLKHGVSEREAMERSGHVTDKMIKKYQHVLEEMDRNSANKLNNIISYKSKAKNSKKVR